MAMAFLSQARTKDSRYQVKLFIYNIYKYQFDTSQVGACLVTPAPHRLVAMGYNGMPDGRGFKDDKMDWGTQQSQYSKNQITVNIF